MATVIDLLRHLGERAAPDGDNALAGPVMLPAVTDSPLSLPLPPAIVAAWVRLVGRKTLGHHALALSAAQTQRSVALMGHGASPHDDLLLLLLGQLTRPPQPAMLALMPPNEPSFRQQLIALAEATGVRWLDASHPGGRIAQAQLILTTPSDLHRRVLRYHDRAWRWLWPQLRFVAMPQLHRYTGAEAGHLHWLLRRVERLATHAPLQILSSLASVADVGATLNRLLDRPMHVVAAPDGPSHSVLIALWRCGSDRGATLIQLAEQLSARHLAITVFGRDEAETIQLRTQAAERGIALPDEARVAIVAGVPRAIDDRQQLLRSGYRLLILLAGDEPHELLFAAQPDLLLSALPQWPLATHNPYVVAPQLTCAAVEHPLEEAEIDRWAVRELRDRLIKKNVLQPLPSGDLWQSAPDIDEPYAELDPQAIGGEPLTILSPAGEPIATIPPALQDRCLLERQVFEPGLQIAGRDASGLVVQLAPDPIQRATVVLSEMTVRVREELAARTIRFGKQTNDLLKGKVWASQRIVGLRELRPDTTERRLPTDAPQTEWLAAACWLPLTEPITDPQAIGWTIAQALPIVALAPPASLAVTYDAEQRRLYLIEVEPGGVGIIDCIYHEFEMLIELASQIAQSCRIRPLYKRLAAAELVWLNGLYGRVSEPEPIQEQQHEKQPESQPAEASRAQLPATPAAPAKVPVPVRAEQASSTPRLPTQLPKAQPPARSNGVAERTEVPQVRASTPAEPAKTQPPTPAPAQAKPQVTAPTPVPPAPAPAQAKLQSAAPTPASTEQVKPTAVPARTQSPAEPIREPTKPAAPARESTPVPQPPKPAVPSNGQRAPVPVRSEQPSVQPVRPAPAQPKPATPPPVISQRPAEAPRRVEQPVSNATNKPTTPAPAAAEPQVVRQAPAPPPEHRAAIYNAAQVPVPPAKPAVTPANTRRYEAPEPIATPAEQPQARPAMPQATKHESQSPAAAPASIAQPQAQPEAVKVIVTPAAKVESTPVIEDVPAPTAQPETLPVVEDVSTTTGAPEAPTIVENVPAAAEPKPEPVVEVEPAPAEIEELPLQPRPIAERRPSIVDRLGLDQEEPEELPVPQPASRDDQPDEAVTATQDQGVADEETGAAPPASQQPELPTNLPIRRPHEPTPRRRITAQYSIDDLLPPLDDEEEDEEAAFVEEQPARYSEPPVPTSRKEPVAPLDTPRSRNPVPRRSEPEIVADELININAEEDEDELPVERYPARREQPPSQRPATSPPNRPPYQRKEPQRPFAQRTPSRQNPTPPAPRREQPTPPPADRQRTYPPRGAQNQPPANQSRGAQNQPPTNPPRRADLTNTRRDQQDQRPHRPERQEPPPRDTRKAPPVSPKPAAPEPEADVNAMIARMRRLREEREASQRPATTPRSERPAQTEPVELRFHIGERVQCLPYGIGTVRASSIVDGREQVLIDFPEYGEIEVDPALNLIRQLGASPSADQNEFDED